MRRRFLKGTTLIEACLAWSLTMVSVMGCFTVLQMAIKWRRTVETEAWALTQAESLADAIRRAPNADVLHDLLYEAKKRITKQLPNGTLSWTAQSEQVYQIRLSWKLPEVHRIDFTVILKDFL